MTDVGLAEPPPAGPDTAVERDLGSRAARGFVWTSARALFVRALSLVSFIVLARLLNPQDYGLAALATVFTSFVQVLASAGMSPALVQRTTVDKTDLDTAFWMSLGIASVVALVLALAAWPLATAFDEPKLRPVLQVLCVGIVVTGLGGAHQAVLQRRLAFDAIAKAGMISNVVATAFGVGFAFLGFGVWALVVQSALAPGGTAIGFMLRSGYRPGFDISLTRLRSLFGFSKNVIGVSFMTFLNQRSSDFLIGAFIGTAALGTYTVAYRLLVVMLEVLVASVQGVLFPMFSRLQSERARLRRAYLSANRMSAVISFPTFLFVLVAAPQIVDVLFGAKWAHSVPVMEVLCLSGPVSALMQVNAAVLTGIGRPNIVFRLTAAGAIIQVVSFLLVMQYGLVWVAVTFVARLYVMAPIAVVVASRELDSPMPEFFRTLVPATVATAAMVVAVELAQVAIGDVLPAVATLAVLAAVAAPVFLGVLRLAGPTHFAEALRYARSLRSAAAS